MAQFILPDASLWKPFFDARLKYKAQLVSFSNDLPIRRQYINHTKQVFQQYTVELQESPAAETYVPFETLLAQVPPHYKVTTHNVLHNAVATNPKVRILFIGTLGKTALVRAYVFGAFDKNMTVVPSNRVFEPIVQHANGTTCKLVYVTICISLLVLTISKVMTGYIINTRIFVTKQMLLLDA